tara:strand:+ start:19156 stop:19419 length:264 start_codon:yes stop_codon:yes gene_type:complete
MATTWRRRETVRPYVPQREEGLNRLFDMTTGAAARTRDIANVDMRPCVRRGVSALSETLCKKPRQLFSTADSAQRAAPWAMPISGAW